MGLLSAVEVTTRSGSRYRLRSKKLRNGRLAHCITLLDANGREEHPFEEGVPGIIALDRLPLPGEKIIGPMPHRQGMVFRSSPVVSVVTVP